jgi:hypothetical protein
LNHPVKADDGFINDHDEIIEFIKEFQMSPITFFELKSTHVVEQDELMLEVVEYYSQLPPEEQNKIVPPQSLKKE